MHDDVEEAARQPQTPARPAAASTSGTSGTPEPPRAPRAPGSPAGTPSPSGAYRTLLTSTTPTPRVASAPASVTMPRRRVRASVGYIASPDSPEARKRIEQASPSRRRTKKAAAADEALPEPAVHALVRECDEGAGAGAGAGASAPADVSALNTRVLHAVAAKERRCLELREELAREDAMLNELRGAWRRLAMRGVPVAGVAAMHPTEGHAAAADGGGSDAQRQARRTSALVADSWSTIQRQIETHITPLVRPADEAPPVPPKDEATVRSVASERLAHGWSTLSRRLRETAMRIGDSAWIEEEEPPHSHEEYAAMRAALDEPSWRLSSIGTPLAAGPGVTALGMYPRWTGGARHGDADGSSGSGSGSGSGAADRDDASYPPRPGR